MPADIEAIPYAGSLETRLNGTTDAAVTLHWLGQAGFVIQAGRNRLVIDPYLSDSLAEKYKGRPFPHERMMPAPVTAEGLGPVDLVLCTHQHTDHMDPQTLAPLARANPQARFVVPQAARDEAKTRIEVGESCLVMLDAGLSAAPLPGVTVTALRAAHEALETDAAGHHRFLGYVIDLAGIRIYHSGDTVPFDGLAEDLAALGPDLALLPVNGRDDHRRANGVPGNLTLDEAVALCAAARIPAMIAHHYGMFAFNTIPAEEIDDRIAAQASNPVLLRAQPNMEYSLRVT
jgi:L-ascorbate metabolism protein UlaG (beta-lactamase superfamily)